MKRAFFIFIFFLLIQSVTFSQADNKDSCYTKPKPQDCFEALGYYSQYWIQDSLTKTGFRDLFASEYFIRCTCFRGRKWSEISEFLGKPNFVVSAKKYLKEGEILYRYMLHSVGDIKDFKDIGNRNLDIIVYEGIIVFFGIEEIDG